MKLVDKAAIVTEIERRKKYYENIQMIKPVYESNIEDLNDLLSFIDTLEVKEVKEEPVSEDLEEAVENYAATGKVLPNGKVMINFQAEKAFRAGANWKKEQMIAKAIDAQCFGFQSDALFSFRLPADNYLVGSEVKVIIIKED
jgi:hypothetical protein